MLSALVLLLAITGTSDVTAAESEESGESKPFRPDTAGPIVNLTAIIPDRHDIVVQPIFQAAFTRGTWNGSGTFTPPRPDDSARFMTVLTYLEFSLFERLSLGGQFGLLHASDSGGGSGTLGPAGSYLFTRFVALEETAAWPPQVTLAAVLALSDRTFGTTTPALLGLGVPRTGTTDVALGGNLTKGIRPLLLHFELFGAYPGLRDDGVHPGPYFVYSLAAELPFLDDTYAAMFELSGRLQSDARQGGVKLPDTAVEEMVIGVAFEWILSKHVQLLLGWQRSIAGRNVPAADALVVTLVPAL